MISNSKSFLIQAFIALTILASSLTFSVTVNAAAIAPARFARQGPVGGILTNAAGNAVKTLCSSIILHLVDLERSVSSSNDIQDIKDTIFGHDVICNGTSSTPDAATVDTFSGDPFVDITPEGVADAQTAANADASLATDVTQDNALNAVQDICNALQGFITANCKDTNICLRIGSLVNNDCINAIHSASPTSSDR